MNYLSDIWSWYTPAEVDSGPVNTAYQATDLLNFRVNDLRRYIKSYGVSIDKVNAILDKKELTDLLVSLQDQTAQARRDKQWNDTAWKITFIMFVITLFYILRTPLLLLRETILSHFQGIVYQLRQQLGLVNTARKQSQYLAGIALLIGIFLEIIQQWMKFSTLASWVLPHGPHPLKVLLFPYFITLDVTTDILPSKATRNTVLEKVPAGINMAPMIYMSVIGYIKHYLQEAGAKPIAQAILAKESRKEKKRVSKQLLEDYDAQNAFRADDEEVEVHAQAQARVHTYVDANIDIDVNVELEDVNPEEAAYAHTFTSTSADIDGADINADADIDAYSDAGKSNSASSWVGQERVEEIKEVQINWDKFGLDHWNESDYICKKHVKLSHETPLSPPRYNCISCHERKVKGYTNPDHGSNPFGYLYLVPKMCTDCSVSLKRCMWCNAEKKEKKEEDEDEDEEEQGCWKEVPSPPPLPKPSPI